nr:hypothetical protein [Tanacetum cinerariifolium]
MDSFDLRLQAWYLDDGTIVGDTLIIGKVLKLITKDGPCCGLHLNVDKTEIFWPKEYPRSKLEGVFPPNISRPLQGVKLLGGPVSVAPDFSSSLVMKKVSKTIGLLDAVAKINDLQCYVLTYAFIASRLQCVVLRIKLLRHVGIVAPGSTFDDALCMFNNSIEIDFLCNPSEIAAPKLMKKMAVIYFTQVTKDVESSFSLSPRQMALWQSQWEDNASDWLHVVLIYGLGQTMNDICFRSEISTGKEVDIRLGGGSFPLTRTGMVDFVPGRAVTEAAQRKRIKYEAKCADIGYGCLSFSFSSFGELKKDVVTLLKRIRKFSMAQDIGARAAVHILNRISFSIAKEADIYFTWVPKNAKSTFSLTPRQMDLWTSQREDHASDWLRTVPISGLFKGFCWSYRDHVVSCAGIIGIKLRHNVVRYTLVDICYRSGISAGKEVDIGLGSGHDKPLRPADILLYSWDEGLDVFVDLTGSSPLTQTGVLDFVSGWVVIDVAQRTRTGRRPPPPATTPPPPENFSGGIFPAKPKRLPSLRSIQSPRSLSIKRHPPPCHLQPPPLPTLPHHTTRCHRHPLQHSPRHHHTANTIMITPAAVSQHHCHHRTSPPPSTSPPLSPSFSCHSAAILYTTTTADATPPPSSPFFFLRVWIY